MMKTIKITHCCYIGFLITVTIFGFLFLSQKQSQYHALRNLEHKYHGKLGVYIIRANNEEVIAFHANQRFPFCSTAKVMIVAALLKQSESDNTLLSKRMYFTIEDIHYSGFAPVTKKFIATGMTVQELCRAAISFSDNAAANILIELVGGPKSITQFARSIGDADFRLDRTEPELNTAIPEDKRDTSTPKAMALSLQKLVLGDVLALKQRLLLKEWLINNTTGDNKIRASTPGNWMVGDKTGAGDYGTSNDLAIIWPPNQEPLVMAVYFTQPYADASSDSNGVVAEVTNVLINR